MVINVIGENHQDVIPVFPILTRIPLLSQFVMNLYLFRKRTTQSFFACFSVMFYVIVISLR